MMFSLVIKSFLGLNCLQPLTDIVVVYVYAHSIQFSLYGVIIFNSYVDLKFVLAASVNKLIPPGVLAVLVRFAILPLRSSYSSLLSCSPSSS